jgi:hypothetical protein
MDVPEKIDGYAVVEYGFFRTPILPRNYVPPGDGKVPLEPIQNVAICTAPGVDGFYLLFCTPEWRYVTYSFNETLKYTKRVPLEEFGEDVAVWRRRA